MEDAHVIHMQDKWGFFGVFDGHGGEACSAFVANEFYKALENGCPKDDAEIKRIVLKIDEDFLAQGVPSGSTGAMCIIEKPSAPEGKFGLRVVNVGDSRVLLGRRDGTIVDGGGTDEGLTIDHKPNHDSERERIERCGGTVEVATGGVHRVNGDLAVSRAFGDAGHKKTGGPGPEDRPVTADPELGRFECDETDFVVIVCDGVSEGDFPNPEVVKLIAETLKDNGDDLGAASKAVCFKAEAMNSKDNITCMIVLLNASPERELEDSKEFTPGPVPSEKSGETAYEAMAQRANLTLGEAIQMRYDILVKELEENPNDDAKIAEKKVIGEPPGERGSDEWLQFFKEWRLQETSSLDQQYGNLISRQHLQEAMMQRVSREVPSGRFAGRKVRCLDDHDRLKTEMETHPQLKWNEKLSQIVAEEGLVEQDDDSDGTMRVKFEKPIGFTAWLPKTVLTVLGDDGVPDPAWEKPESGGGGGGAASPEYLRAINPAAAMARELLVGSSCSNSVDEGCPSDAASTATTASSGYEGDEPRMAPDS